MCMSEGVLLSQRFGRLGMASFSHFDVSLCGPLGFLWVKKTLGQSRKEGRERLGFLLKD